MFCWELIKTLTLSPRRSLVPPAHVFSRCFSSAESDSKRVEDVTPIKTGHDQVKDIRNIYYHNAPKKEAPVVVESYYDRRLVGCLHGEGWYEDELGCNYFRLFKGKPEKCVHCEQFFELDVVGPGTPP